MVDGVACLIANSGSMTMATDGESLEMTIDSPRNCLGGYDGHENWVSADYFVFLNPPMMIPFANIAPFSSLPSGGLLMGCPCLPWVVWRGLPGPMIANLDVAGGFSFPKNSLDCSDDGW